MARSSSARDEARSDLLTQRFGLLIGGDVGEVRSAPMEGRGAAKGEAVAKVAARETVRVARRRHSASGGRLRLPARRGRGCIAWFWVGKMAPVDAIAPHNVGNPFLFDGMGRCTPSRQDSVLSALQTMTAGQGCHRIFAEGGSRGRDGVLVGTGCSWTTSSYEERRDFRTGSEKRAQPNEIGV